MQGGQDGGDVGSFPGSSQQPSSSVLNVQMDIRVEGVAVADL